jgi:fructosamine-3-kinase
VEHRERQRIETLTREMAQRKQQADNEERQRKRLSDLLETWDDEEKIERGREWFYSDRCVHQGTVLILDPGGVLRGSRIVPVNIKMISGIDGVRKKSKRHWSRSLRSS